MDKSLNDRIEGIFRGVVFIVLSFAASLALLAIRPCSGYARLVRRLRQKSSEQVRPYAFVFFAIMVVFFAPTVIDAVAPQPPGPRDFVIHEYASEPGALGRAYEQATQRIESKAATAIFVAAIVGVAAFHLGATAAGYMLFRQRARRQTWLQALFFVGGMQVVLCGAGLLLDRIDNRELTEVGLIKDFLALPVNVHFQPDRFRHYSAYRDLLELILLAIVLALPIGMAARFAKRATPGGRRFSQRFRWLLTVGLAMFVNLTVIGSFSLAAYTADEVQPRERVKIPFSLRNLSCEIDIKSATPRISGLVTVTVDPKSAWAFDGNDVSLFVVANRTAADGPAPFRSKSGSNVEGRIGLPARILVNFSAISPALGRPPFLMQAGQAGLFRFETEESASLSILKFLAEHPDGRLCTLRDFLKYPIGAIAPLDVRGESKPQ